MIHEISHLTVPPGGGPALEEAFAAVIGILEAAEGFRSVSLDRCVETPDEYVLVLQWASVEAHLVDFKQSDRYQEFATAIVGALAGPSRSAHYEPRVVRSRQRN